MDCHLPSNRISSPEHLPRNSAIAIPDQTALALISCGLYPNDVGEEAHVRRSSFVLSSAEMLYEFIFVLDSFGCAKKFTVSWAPLLECC
jgi:hypothetical protein